MDVVRAYGIFYAATEGVAKALVADLVPESQRGTAYGLFNAAIGITALPLRFSLDFYGRDLVHGQDQPLSTILLRRDSGFDCKHFILAHEVI